jgi:hypothetical protein
MRERGIYKKLKRDPVGVFLLSSFAVSDERNGSLVQGSRVQKFKVGFEIKLRAAGERR